jgi:hypothetical protein
MQVINKHFIIIFKLTFYSYKADYLTTQLLINRAENLTLNKNDNDLNIYLEEKKNLNELSRYFFIKKKANRQVNYYLLKFIINY